MTEGAGLEQRAEGQGVTLAGRLTQPTGLRVVKADGVNCWLHGLMS